MDPVEALERIVHCLDRAREESYKVRAFKGAAAVVAELGPEATAARVADGTLKDLPGIGATTFTVIAEAVAGQVPAYLTKLEGSTAVVESPESAALRATLKGDCHTHTTWSDGGAQLHEMANTARRLGHEYLVVTDHSPRLTIAHGLNRERLEAQLDDIAALNAEMAPFRVLTGMEVDILEDGALDCDEDLLERLDVVVASVHSKLRMDERGMTTRMVRAVASPHVDILGHCTGRMLVGRGRPESTFDADLVFAACAQFDTAVEINCRPERLDPPMRLLELAIEWNCRFSIDTDAHATGQLEWQPYGCERAVKAGVDPERIVNRWGVDELLDWAGSHPGS